MKHVMVIREFDMQDNEKSVICVVTSRIKALELISEYYGKDHIMTNFKDIREDNFDFSCNIEVKGSFGGFYKIIAEDFTIDSI